MGLAAWVKRAIQGAGVAITDVSIGDDLNKTTWRVSPTSLQNAAQATIDAFDPDDPAHALAELEIEVKGALDTQRLLSAIVWAIIDTYSAPATPAKYQAARTRIITAYKNRPWLG